MNAPQARAADPALDQSAETAATVVEMQAAVRQLADTRAALRKCLSDLIESSVLTWR